ncbi:22964_t:CDS:2 [Cetraspora pellucida]|uniref:22964_t:CDS:1 n=1 Tax=Cetraspora pellucida TaxID=1433469 RepID=A0A9N9N3H7_9GLOM|nr:22964_t:CDS:2 [Cetraspora pellucida]
MVWLKKTYKFVGRKNENAAKSEKCKFVPFWWTLFSWRRNDLSRQKNQKIIPQTLSSQKVNSLLFLSIFNFIPRLIIHEIWACIIEYFSPEVPERPYALRILDYFYAQTQSSAITSPYMLFYCYLYGGFLYQNMDYVFHLFKVFAAVLLWIIYLIHMTLYLHSLLTTTPQLFNKPFLSQNPKDFWSKRWHQMYRSSFTELGYFPIINFLENFNNSSSLRVTLFSRVNSAGKFHLMVSNFTTLLRRLGSLLGYKTFLRSKKIQKDVQNIETVNQNEEFLKSDHIFKNKESTFTAYGELSRALAIIGSFLWSAILHEYLFVGLFGWNNSRGEHFSFFLVHAMIMIIWDVLGKLFNKCWRSYYYCGRHEKNELKKTGNILFMIKKIIGFMIWNFVLTLTLPWFIEPYIRLRHFYCVPHLGCQRKL